MTLPPSVAAQLGKDLAEEYEERAAIMQYDGGMRREEAEHQALEIVKMKAKAFAVRGGLHGGGESPASRMKPREPGNA